MAGLSESLEHPLTGLSADTATLMAAYRRVRQQTEALCEPLAIEDYGVQPMADASPPKWHLAHTSWFFETFLLKPAGSDYQVYDPRFEYLFNSYYNSVGEQFPRAQRGNLSRPTVAEVIAYRRHVDRAMEKLLEAEKADPAALSLGLHHEQQHQELMLTDVKNNLGRNPIHPPYRSDLREAVPVAASRPARFVEFAGGDVEVGADGARFCFDNELPRHRVHLQGFGLADRLVNNAEYLAFIEDDGYRRPELWLSDAWAALRAGTMRQAPLYWSHHEGWCEYGLGGLWELNPDQPVIHVSAYEADAFARWSGARLPTEFEWEHASATVPVAGNFVESQLLAPQPPQFQADGQNDDQGRGLSQMFGDAWEWTASSYSPYPGYRPLGGSFGEYNGKFMSNQLVLRGGSCVTPGDHIRASYRNFFYPGDQWQFSGIRLARDVE